MGGGVGRGVEGAPSWLWQPTTARARIGSSFLLYARNESVIVHINHRIPFFLKYAAT
jgi:hypothetical protein